MTAAGDATERRRFVRVDDNIALVIRTIPKNKYQQALEQFQYEREKFGLPNMLRIEREQHLPDYKVLENRYPEVAHYFTYLERQFERVVSLVGPEDAIIPHEPNQLVNLSAQGIRFKSEATYNENDLLELRMLLFPSHTRILAFGRVVNWKAGSSELALNFEEILEEDRELLIKHVHQLQVKSLQKPESNIKT